MVVAEWYPEHEHSGVVAWKSLMSTIPNFGVVSSQYASPEVLVLLVEES